MAVAADSELDDPLKAFESFEKKVDKSAMNRLDGYTFH